MKTPSQFLQDNAARDKIKAGTPTFTALEVAKLLKKYGEYIAGEYDKHMDSSAIKNLNQSLDKTH